MFTMAISLSAVAAYKTVSKERRKQDHNGVARHAHHARQRAYVAASMSRMSPPFTTARRVAAKMFARREGRRAGVCARVCHEQAYMRRGGRRSERVVVAYRVALAWRRAKSEVRQYYRFAFTRAAASPTPDAGTPRLSTCFPLLISAHAAGG